MTRVDLALRSAKNAPIAIGVGFVAADIVEGSAEEFVAAGGSCGNVTAILAWLGWKSYPVARLGRDWAAGVIRSDLARYGVQSVVSEESAIQTPIVIQRFVHDKQGKRVHRFSLACPECGGWLPRYRASTLLQAAAVAESALHPRAYYMDRVSPAAIRLAEWARAAGAMVIFEPSSISEERSFQRAVDLCHVLKYSHDQLGHVRDLQNAGSPKIIIETRAEEGLRVRWRGHWTELPAFHPPRFIDGAGAGDWCTAGVVHQLAAAGAKALEQLQKTRLVSALRFGQGLAAVNCAFEGARGAMMAMTQEQLAKRLQTLVAKRPELVEPEDGVEIPDTEIPTRLCATCSSAGKSSSRKRKRASE
jgi:sugar/nucleoside kinase (ribokinase family)